MRRSSTTLWSPAIWFLASTNLPTLALTPISPNRSATTRIDRSEFQIMMRRWLTFRSPRHPHLHPHPHPHPHPPAPPPPPRLPRTPPHRRHPPRRPPPRRHLHPLLHLHRHRLLHPQLHLLLR